jgi:hypothetical protein
MEDDALVVLAARCDGNEAAEHALDSLRAVIVRFKKERSMLDLLVASDAAARDNLRDQIITAENQRNIAIRALESWRESALSGSAEHATTLAEVTRLRGASTRLTRALQAALTVWGSRDPGGDGADEATYRLVTDTLTQDGQK